MSERVKRSEKEGGCPTHKKSCTRTTAEGAGHVSRTRARAFKGSQIKMLYGGSPGVTSDADAWSGGGPFRCLGSPIMRTVPGSPGMRRV